MADNGWFEGSNSPGAGDLGQIQALQQNLALTADAARHAKSDLSGLKDQVSDAVWRGRPAEEFKDNIDDKFLGELDQLDTSYQDAADGFQTYIAAVSDIKHRADSLATKIYAAQSHYESSAGALHGWLLAHPSEGSYSHGELSAPSIHAGSPYTGSYHAAPAPSGASVSPSAADAAAATAAGVQQQHSTLQNTVNDAFDGLQALYRQMDGLKTHDRVAADNAVAGRINKAGKAGMHNESGWHKFFHALSTIAKWVAIALIVIAVVAVVVLMTGGAGLGLLAALAEVVTTDALIGSVVVYGGAMASGLALVGDVGQTYSGGGPGWEKIGLDVLGIVPGLGKGAELLGEAGGSIGTAASALHDGAIVARLKSVYGIEGLFSKIEYTGFGLKFAGLMDKTEGGLGIVNKAILGFGENRPIDSTFGAVKWMGLKTNGLWGGAGMVFPSISKQAMEQAGKAQVQAATHDLSATQARQQILQYQRSSPAAAANAHRIAANLAKGDKAVLSYPKQHGYPQSVPVR